MNEIEKIVTNLNGYKEVTSNVNRINKLDFRFKTLLSSATIENNLWTNENL